LQGSPGVWGRARCCLVCRAWLGGAARRVRVGYGLRGITTADGPRFLFVRAVARGDVMTGLQVDYEAVYRQMPVPVLLLTPDFEIADVNLAFLRSAGREREELLGRNLFEAFPEDRSDPEATGVRNSTASLRRALATGEPDAIEFQRYDVEVPGGAVRHYWSGVNAPAFGPDGRVMLITHCGEDVTDRLRRFMSVLESEAPSGDAARWDDASGRF
jgi:PAS domain S-box-containing protein